VKPTPSQTIGPFFGFALEEEESGGPLKIRGRVLDGEGAAVDDAVVELWDGQHFARALTDASGRWAVRTEQPPGPYIAVSVFARGLLQRLITRIYLDAQAAPDPTLVARQVQDGWEWDIHLQGERETVFFAL
jgi:protocatechuate 3,4-dioxygenase alpha subunit